MVLLRSEQDDNTSTEVTQINETQSKKIQENQLAQIDDKKDNMIQKEPIQDKETQQRERKITEKQNHDTQIDERILRRFLSEGMLTVRHVRCIIVGCANAGKTTLLKRLQNVSYKDLINTDRTEMVDVHVNSFEVPTDEHTIQSKPCF